MTTVASFVVPAAAAVLFSATALLQRSTVHGLLAVASFIVAAIGVALYIARRRAKEDEEDADDPTTGQVIILTLGCVLVMVWGALLVTTMQAADTTPASDVYLRKSDLGYNTNYSSDMPTYSLSNEEYE